MKGKTLVKGLVLTACLFFISLSTSLAQEPCEGNFDYDQDVDAADVTVFLEDFGRSQYNNPCPPPSSTPAPLPKTGQKTSYYSRDDGDFEKGVSWPNPKFIDHGNGTITDTLTGLMWTKNANLAGTPRNWQEAMDYIAGMNGGAGTFGYKDWRLPNIRELCSLIDFGEDVPALPPGHPFINVQTDLESYYYWSSTTYTSHTGGAWVIRMFDGYSNGHYKTGDYFAWPVRGGQ